MGLFSRTTKFELSSDPVDELIAAEEGLDQHIYTDRPLRIKVTEDCGLSCAFCHNEGTVAPTDARQSIYIDDLSPDNARLQAEAVKPDDEFLTVLSWMKDKCDIEEVHWTGGEPTLNPWLADNVRIAAGLSLGNKMTSNGQRGGAGIADLANAGLLSVNFSVYGLTPEQFRLTQIRSSQKTALNRIAALNEAMQEALHVGLSVKANIVVSPTDVYHKITDALDIIDPRVQLRFQSDLRDQESGGRAVRTVMVALGAKAVERSYSLGSSNQMIKYVVDDYDGRVVGLKSFRRSRMASICDGCPIDAAGKCEEGYYGPRLFREKGVNGIGGFVVGVCLQRMELAQRFDVLRDEYEAARFPRPPLKRANYQSLAYSIRRQPTVDDDDILLKRSGVTKIIHDEGRIMVVLPKDVHLPI